MTYRSYQNSDLSVFLATPEQTRQATIRASAAWKGTRTLEQFLARETALDECEHALHGRCATWVLAPVNTPKSLDFLSSCRTFRREILWVPESDTATARSGIAYSVTSVFTPESERRKGYARLMMKLLHWVLSSDEYRRGLQFPEDWGSRPIVPRGYGNAILSILYSNIGEEFYLCCGPTPDIKGWHLKTSQEVAFNLERLLNSLQVKMVPEESDQSDIRWLDKKAAEDVWDRDSDEIARNIMCGHACPRFAFLPTKGVAAYPFQRFHCDVSKIDGLDYGVELTSNPGALVFATWAPGSMVLAPQQRELIVTRLRCPPNMLAALLSCIAQCAAKQTPPLGRIEIWNLGDDLMKVAIELGGISRTRSRHVSMVAGYDLPNHATWLFNEKYAWS